MEILRYIIVLTIVITYAEYSFANVQSKVVLGYTLIVDTKVSIENHHLIKAYENVTLAQDGSTVLKNTTGYTVYKIPDICSPINYCGNATLTNCQPLDTSIARCSCKSGYFLMVKLDNFNRTEIICNIDPCNSNPCPSNQQCKYKNETSYDCHPIIATTTIESGIASTNVHTPSLVTIVTDASPTENYIIVEKVPVWSIALIALLVFLVLLQTVAVVILIKRKKSQVKDTTVNPIPPSFHYTVDEKNPSSGLYLEPIKAPKQEKEENMVYQNELVTDSAYEDLNVKQ